MGGFTLLNVLFVDKGCGKFTLLDVLCGDTGLGTLCRVVHMVNWEGLYYSL